MKMEGIKNRPGKRKRRNTFGGKSFTEALKEKYCTLMDNYNCTSGFIIDIVLTGMPKKTNSDAELDFLRNVVLSCKGVSCAGLPHGGLSSLCPNVVDLDLSSNLLDDWEESLTIMSQLPCLKFVNLSRNILINKENFLQKWQKPLPQIENLVLNQTGVPWEDIVTLSHHIPSLRELHICDNETKEVNHQCGVTKATQTDENGNDTQNLVRNLVSNLISQAVHEMLNMDCDEEASDLSDSENDDNVTDADISDNLDSYYHSNIEMESMHEDVEMMVESEARERDDSPNCLKCGLKIKYISSKNVPFESLKNLCLSQTGLSDWEDLQALSQFPSLESLRIMDISLVSDMSREERRKLYLANLPNIKILNASEVTSTERDKAERHFLRHFTDKETKPKRCAELESKHGKLNPLVEIDLGRNLKEWVALHFYFKGMKAFTHTVRVFDPVGTLRLLAAEKLNLYAS
ncbi:hypothetical protein KUTeg_000079 [Tegillarca granosa]|uniref:Tubulin-specific chaperone cofactor E-like protein n=1 Tax=Tegillarca granosa TaxID=220873 RepID=A0ABQ9FWI8_TEGGR|nr:hypothetical protein KUTeg_000079 [Tegillarca granosa]